jgi:hypothetical protein
VCSCFVLFFLFLFFFCRLGVWVVTATAGVTIRPVTKNGASSACRQLTAEADR